MLQPIRVESRVWKKIIISRSNVRYFKNNITETMHDNGINDITSGWIGIFLLWVAQIEAVTICGRCSKVVTTKKLLFTVNCPLRIVINHVILQTQITWFYYHFTSVQITWFMSKSRDLYLELKVSIITIEVFSCFTVVLDCACV